MDLSKRVDSFEIKLRQLASKIDRQRAENVALARENDELKSELDRQRGVVSSLKEKLTRAQQVAGIDSMTDDVADHHQRRHVIPQHVVATCFGKQVGRQLADYPLKIPSNCRSTVKPIHGTT